MLSKRSPPPKNKNVVAAENVLQILGINRTDLILSSHHDHQGQLPPGSVWEKITNQTHKSPTTGASVVEGSFRGWKIYAAKLAVGKSASSPLSPILQEHRQVWGNKRVRNCFLDILCQLRKLANNNNGSNPWDDGKQNKAIASTRERVDAYAWEPSGKWNSAASLWVHRCASVSQPQTHSFGCKLLKVLV